MFSTQSTLRRVVFLFGATTLFFASTALAAPPGVLETTAPRSPICNALDQDIRIGDDDTTTEGRVSFLQNFLYETGYYPHTGVGEFGWLTFYSLAQFQRENGLPGSGYFGPLTRALIFSRHCVQSYSPPPVTSGGGPPGTVYGTSTISLPTPTGTPSTGTSTTNSSKNLPYNITDFSNDWEQSWGSVTTTPTRTLLLQAAENTTGAESILTGSKDWGDYSYTAHVVANVNGSVSLIGRYTDSNNFIACTFSGPSVKITENLNGKKKDVATERTNIPRPVSVLIDTTMKMKVKGNQVICSATGKDDVSYTITNSKLLKGGIGISIWHSVPGVTSLELREVTVTAL